MKSIRIALLFVGIAAMSLGAVPAAAAPPDHSHTKVYRLEDGSQVNGGVSKLTRHGDAISMKLKTRDLLPGGAYTVWWMVFNHPEHCIGECDNPDIDVPAVDGTIFWAAGGVVGNSGVHKFEGSVVQDAPPTVDIRKGSGILTNAAGAEIHLVVRSHGAVIPGLVEEQTYTFGGGCEINDCVNEQFTKHMP